MKARRTPYLLLLLVGLPLLYWALLAPRGFKVEIAARTWQHDVDVERFGPELELDWCDKMPKGAEVVEMRRASGEKGDGLRCSYRMYRYVKIYFLRAEGQWPQQPTWPKAELADLPPNTLGAERLGPRKTRYHWVLRDEAGHEWPCLLPHHVWLTKPVGTQMRVSVDRWGTADCASLPL